MIDYMAIAIERGQTPEPCESCGGTGYHFDPRTCDETPCLACLTLGGDRRGTGLETGHCECGYHGILVPDQHRSADGTCDGAYLRCPRCAVTCDDGCGRVSTRRDEHGDQYCDECWKVELLRLSVLEQAEHAVPANEREAVAR